MKITPKASGQNMSGNVLAGGDAVVPNTAAMRSFKMNVNRTPGRELTEGQTAPVVTIPDSNRATESSAEATQPISPQLAAIAKARRALEAREKALAEREKASQNPTPVSEGAIELAQLKSDPLGVLLKAGVTYDQLTEAILANQNGDGAKLAALEAKIAALEQGVEKKLTDRELNAKQQVIAQMTRDAQAIVDQNEDYELVKHEKCVPEVIQYIEEHYDKTGEVLDTRDVLAKFEDWLVKDYQQRVDLYNRVQNRLAPPSAPQPQQQQRQMRTLTNRDTASVPMSAKARALAAFTGTLKR